MIPRLSESEKPPSAIVVDGSLGHEHIFVRSRRSTYWPIREANDQRLVNVLIMNQHDNLSQTLGFFGLIKQVQLTLLHCLIVFGFRRYSPLKKIGRCLKNSNMLSAQIMLRLLAGVAEY